MATASPPPSGRARTTTPPLPRPSSSSTRYVPRRRGGALTRSAPSRARSAAPRRASRTSQHVPHGQPRLLELPVQLPVRDPQSARSLGGVLVRADGVADALEL